MVEKRRCNPNRKLTDDMKKALELREEYPFVTLKVWAKKAGVNYDMLTKWRNKNTPEYSNRFFQKEQKIYENQNREIKQKRVEIEREEFHIIESISRKALDLLEDQLDEGKGSYIDAGLRLRKERREEEREEERLATSGVMYILQGMTPIDDKTISNMLGISIEDYKKELKECLGQDVFKEEYPDNEHL